MPTTSISLSRAMLVVLLAMFTSGCEAIAGIFKAGFWAGAIAVVIIIAIIGFVVSRVRS